MNKYKLIGITKKAKRVIPAEPYSIIKNCIGTIIKDYNKPYVTLSNGVNVHESFLILEEIKELKYKLLGLTPEALDYLSESDIKDVQELIGTIVTKEIIDGKEVYILADGLPIHINYIEIKTITDDTN